MWIFKWIFFVKFCWDLTSKFISSLQFALQGFGDMSNYCYTPESDGYQGLKFDDPVCQAKLTYLMNMFSCSHK